MSAQQAATASRLARTFIGGRISFNDKSSTFDCVARQLSDSGAVLELGSTFMVPRVFVLETKPFGRRDGCIVSSRTHTSVAVDFVQSAGIAS